jgi:adenylate cyclase
MAVDRKLSAILAADVVGYSRLMGDDEEGTLASLNSHRNDHIDPCIARYRGRVVKSTGDGVLAEFGSAVDAVRCALEIQEGMANRNADVATDRRLVLRIGINVGDIVEQDGDIFGDGVNVAARLEGIADPGGICVSERVQDYAAGRVQAAFEDLGPKSLKNIARPVRAFRLTPASTISGHSAATGPSPIANSAQLPEKPAIAVLPFQNMSGDVEQDYFADGIVEDIITALSRFRSFAVVARNSSFVYKGRSVDVRQAARELGVRYVLEGSVRRSGQRLRVTAQLLDGASGAHLWAHNFDGVVEDIFDVQDRITESIVGIIEPQIRQAEIERSRRKRPENLDAYDLYLKGIAKIYTARLEDNAEAYALLSEAIERDPTYAPALINAAWALETRGSMGWPSLTHNDRAASLDLANRALAEANDDATVLAFAGIVLIHVGHDYERGLRVVENAVATNPNNQLVLICAAVAEIHCGSLQRAIVHSERATALSSRDPTVHWALTATAHAHLALGNYDEALQAAEQSLAVNSNFNATYWMLIASNAHLGRIDQARSWLAKFRTMVPSVTIASIRKGQPSKDPSRNAAIYEGLRIAGLDEE